MAHNQTLKLTSDGDLHPSTLSNNAGMLDGGEAIKQELKILLLTIQGEDPFAERHGLRLFDALGSPESVLEREIRFALLGDDRVAEIVSVSFEEPDTASRKRRVSVRVRLTEDAIDAVDALNMEVTFDEQ
jgi:phage baseplate assembly protein W